VPATVATSIRFHHPLLINFEYRTYTTYEEVVADFEGGSLHPGDLKPAVAKAINEMIKPVREHFQKDPQAKKLLDQVKNFKVTR
jgi:tyrosyl-tRNA synthetase